MGEAFITRRGSTGNRVAVGIVKAPHYGSISISGIGFKPKHIIVTPYDMPYESDWFVGLEWREPDEYLYRYRSNNQNSGQNEKTGTSASGDECFYMTTTNDGFTLQLDNGGSGDYFRGNTYYWIAFEEPRYTTKL